ncbi:MAG: glycerol-3-phosphate O-acyltransferase/dihydroxyacetone phosphate acyltransferase [Saprospiraceae bacterium]|jgi:glycerol-3-phosphate O-acyltransferase/dihydroxyacetone phosphate acyltransferase
MLYFFAKYFCRIGLRVNFKKIFFHYQEEIPENKAIIFASNHPTAFLDPVMVGAFIKRPVHFIVRGDIFKGKFILAFLNGLKMLPIFRFRDGYSSLKNNQATLETVYEKLSQNRCVLILAEGETKHEKRLRPIQKGTARMAFGAIEAQGDLDILIIPVGVNYSDSDAYRSFVMTEFGKPIHLNDYKPVYQENPRKAIKQLTGRIEKEMRSLVIHIEKEADDIWVNRILEIKRSDFDFPSFPILSDDSTLWQKEFEAVEKMNAFADNQKAAIQKLLKAYDQKLESSKVSDRGLARAASYNFLNTIFLILGIIPFLVGYMMSYLPLSFAEYSTKQKVKKIEFYSSVRYGIGWVGYIIYWLVLLIISLVLGNKWGIGFVIAIPFLGYFAQVYMEFFQTWNAARKFKALSKEDQKVLIEKRKTLLSNV